MLILCNSIRYKCTTNRINATHNQNIVQYIYNVVFVGNMTSIKETSLFPPVYSLHFLASQKMIGLIFFLHQNSS
jgi:hypothetical protein